MKKLLIILLLSGCASVEAVEPVWVDKQAAVVSAHRENNIQHYRVEIYPTVAEVKLLEAAAHQPTLRRLIKSLDKTCDLPAAKKDLSKGWTYRYELFSTDRLVSRISYSAKECDIEVGQSN